MTDTRTVPYAALVLRLSLGVLFLAHAALKILVFTPAGTVQFFASLGLPPALAYLTMLGEAGGGAALVLGLYTRAISLALVPLLIGAIVTAHASNGWLFSNAGGGWEFPAFWAATLVVQALLGDGAFALKVPSLGRLAAATQS
jgi:putative oxidoreductase